MARVKKTRHSERLVETTTRPVSIHVLRLREALKEGMASHAVLDLRGRSVEVCHGADAFWAIVRRTDRGGVALRLADAPGGAYDFEQLRSSKDRFAFRFSAIAGLHEVELRLFDDEVPVLRSTCTLTPATDLLASYSPRDLYPLGEGDDPLAAEGRVEAAQRGLNSGVCLFQLDRPAFGTILYFQNFTALNDRFLATGTTPDGAVGGEWPELGYLPPSPRQSPQPPLDPLPADKPVIVSDAFMAFHDGVDADETTLAQHHLTLKAAIYRRLELPDPQFHDWVDRAERSLRDLDQAREATIAHYGYRYVHPYTDAEYPDSMVQLSITAALRDYEAWCGQAVPLRAELQRGIGKFYDPRLKTLRRYLPNVGKDKDKDVVDSWYLYHPLVNLGRLAIDGDRQADRLFRKSIDYAIRAARHFDYHWPIQYKVTDFSVIQEARDDTGLGQTDVGGIYAYLMLQAFQLTDEKRFLDEARAAIRAAKGMRFELNYQANLTAWGAAACMRLWRIDEDPAWLAQSYVYLASFFHNAAMWESKIGHARHYPNFLGVTALHDAPYMAMYECFDSFAAFERYIKDGGPELDSSVRMLISEYCRYALDRAWFYYPDSLPREAIADKQRENNGFIAHDRSFPVEDLYIDGQQAGQVGQEIYGSGAAFVFASRTFHRFEDVPFDLFCDHFLLAADQPNERTLGFQLGGGDGCLAKMVLLPRHGSKLPDITVTSQSGDRVRPRGAREGRRTFAVPASGRVTLSW